MKRALRYELDTNGAWRAVGRYDVGFYDRQKEGEPLQRASCEGGIAFGLGYDSNWVADQGKPDQFVWITGHSLCSAETPCNLSAERQAAAAPGAGGQGSPQAQPAAAQPAPAAPAFDDSEVHGVQGLAENAFEDISAAPANPQAAPEGSAALNQAYLIDTDINVDAQGNVISQELLRNDATKIGDIAIYETCQAPTEYASAFLLQPAAEGGAVIPIGYHFRYGSHSPYWSHSRFRSHNPYWSHNLRESHDLRLSRVHETRISRVHETRESRVHDVRESRVHETPHQPRAQHARKQRA
jgi:hypothetical protein